MVQTALTVISADVLIRLFTAMSTTPLPFDVRLSFARSGEQLWAHSIALERASPYFRTLFSSGFSECQIDTQESVSSVPGAVTAKSVVQQEVDWSDSDDDGDPVGRPTPQEPGHRYRSINVTAHAYRTYQATWVWIVSGFITFAQLHSRHDGHSNPEASSALPPSSELFRPPPAVSPKSVYRLAHFLELATLRDEALDAFKTGLTVDNVAHQLFSSTSDSYDEIRSAAATFAADHWDDVEGTERMKEMMAKVDAREVDHGGVVMKAVAEALVAKARRGG